MLKRISWKSVFRMFAWMICLGGLAVLMSFVNVKKHTVKCTDVKIIIPGADNFIEREEIDAILKQSQGQLTGRDLEHINLHEIEDNIIANPYIERAKVYADMDGIIHIEINQRQPVLRVINKGDQDFYVDKNGLKMPVSPNFTANVLVANGNIPEHFGGKIDTLTTQVAIDLFKTASYIKKDTLWSAQIEQLFVNGDNDIELIPRVGNQRIILGDADSLDVKMKNLLTFYKKAMPDVGWDTYKTINIKYTNQIVCEKNKPDSLSVTHKAVAVVKDTTQSVKRVVDSIVHDAIINDIIDDPRPVAVKKPKAVSPAKPDAAVSVKPAGATRPDKKGTAVQNKKEAAGQVKKDIKADVKAQVKKDAANRKEKVKTDTRKNK